MPGGKKSDDLKPRIVITGASGLLGHALCELAKKQWSVYAVYRQNIPRIEGVVSTKLDLTDIGRACEFLSSVRPEAVIHAAASAQVAACEQFPEKSDEINVSVAEQLARRCARQNTPFVFISTDLVFDGTQAPYAETDTPAPFCIYSDQKVRAEKAVCQNHPGAIICRVPLLLGLGPYANDNFTFQMLQAIDQSRSINLFVDEYRTPVDIHSAAQGVLIALKHGGQSMLHLGGRTRVSRFELGQMLARQMNVAPDMLCPVSIDSFVSMGRRAPDCSLDSRRAYALGYTPLPLEAAVRRIVAQFQNEPQRCIKKDGERT